jgi:hypothetical protein
MGNQPELITLQDVLSIRQTITKNGLFDLHQFANIVARQALEKLAKEVRADGTQTLQKTLETLKETNVT